jgi:hypothetical protein
VDAIARPESVQARSVYRGARQAQTLRRVPRRRFVEADYFSALIAQKAADVVNARINDFVRLRVKLNHAGLLCPLIFR